MADDPSSGERRVTRIPAGLTFAALVGGFGLGFALKAAAPNALVPVLAVADPIGGLWLNALRITIVPLVMALLFTGVAQTVEAAQAGRLARRTVLLFAGVLFGGAVISAVLTPALLALFPSPGASAAALGAAGAERALVPGFADFVRSLVPTNIVAAVAADGILPLTLFTATFALAAMRIGETHRGALVALFKAISEAMLVIIGWVLALAPIGVFALSVTVVARSGGAAIGALAHYVALVALVGSVILIAAYGIAATLGGQRLLPFARALLPAQAVALSTQSSLATLPAMLAVCRRLGVRDDVADLVLPLAVAVFRATGPAMNLAVAIYVARSLGIGLSPAMLVAGALVATLTTLGAVSLPGAVSFISSIGPIALAMGVPVEPLALLIAVEVLPDLMRTLANVTMDVAVTTAVDRARQDRPGSH